jgi:phosphoglycerate transporter family protein
VAPPLARAAVTDPKQVAAMYRHYRVRVLYTLFIGYASYYFTRKNLPGAAAALGAELHYSNTQLGLLGTLLYVTYGIGKFVNGVLGDHTNSRTLLVAGLVLSVVCNVGFGLSSSLVGLALWWALNGWAQSMGFPPCARLLSTWYSTSERGAVWSVWNLSHHVGGMVIALATGTLVAYFGWRACFVVPAGVCVAIAALLWERLPDTPTSLGLPSVGVYRKDAWREADGSPLSEEPESIRQTLVDRVLKNRGVWLVSIMNLFVYLVRSGAFDWAPKYLIEVKHTPAALAGVITSSFEFLGIPGSLLAGVLSDRVFHGRRAPVCALFMLVTAAGLWLFYLVPPGHPVLDAVTLALVGFAVYGPQLLVGVLVVDLASPKAAATAIGLTGIFGYAGSALSGVGIGYCLDHAGWRGGFACFIAAALIGALLALPLWQKGYGRLSK